MVIGISINMIWKMKNVFNQLIGIWNSLKIFFQDFSLGDLSLTQIKDNFFFIYYCNWVSEILTISLLIFESYSLMLSKFH